MIIHITRNRLKLNVSNKRISNSLNYLNNFIMCNPFISVIGQFTRIFFFFPPRMSTEKRRFPRTTPSPLCSGDVMRTRPHKGLLTACKDVHGI